MIPKLYVVVIDDDGPEAPVLHQKAARVELFDEDLATFVGELWQTMTFAHGTGLAAPQVGRSLRVLVAQHKGRRIELVNPTIIEQHGRCSALEGCLSLPGVRVYVQRAESIVVTGHDCLGRPVRIATSGMLARILQHEIDHLDGVLITDRAKAGRKCA